MAREIINFGGRDLLCDTIPSHLKFNHSAMKRLPIFLISVIIIISSCGKKGDTDNSVKPPSDLIVNAVISTDNSGNVSFTASATNTVSFEYDFGNGVTQTVASGVITYKYPGSGAYTVKVTAKNSAGQTLSKSMQVTVTVVLSLVWADEFDLDGAPDPAKWGYDLGAGGWGNAELENYTNRTDNAILSNGTLKIIAKAESYNGSAYTSARLLSKDKFSFKYGKIEVRAKLPTGVGSWPAIWMLGNNISTSGWPACGEIDIMEHLGRDLNKIYATLHHPGHSGANGNGTTVMVPTATTEFHTYSLEWSPASLVISVDDTPFYQFTNNPGLPFNDKFFIILNIAMGGNFGGPVDPAFSSATMEIDYVKVYQ
ncbi:MAG: family 16 glycosylhydrolase [Chitinophagaceae bacterium]